MASASPSTVSASTTLLPTKSPRPLAANPGRWRRREVRRRGLHDLEARVPPPARSGATTTRDRASRPSDVRHCPRHLHVGVRLRSHRRCRVPSHEEKAGLGHPLSYQRPNLTWVNHSAASTLGAHPIVATKATVASRALRQHRRWLSPVRQTRTDRALRGHFRPLLLTDHQYVIEDTDRFFAHPPEGGRPARNSIFEGPRRPAAQLSTRADLIL